jgi:hypothetical protein
MAALRSGTVRLTGQMVSSVLAGGWSRDVAGAGGCAHFLDVLFRFSFVLANYP